MEEIRYKSIDVLRDIVEDEDKCHIIEESIYNFSNKYVKKNSVEEIISEIYTNKFEDILYNLDKTKLNNNYLLDAILCGAIDATNIADLPPHGLFPNKWKKIIDRKKQLLMINIKMMIKMIKIMIIIMIVTIVHIHIYIERER